MIRALIIASLFVVFAGVLDFPFWVTVIGAVVIFALAKGEL